MKLEMNLTTKDFLFQENGKLAKDSQHEDDMICYVVVILMCIYLWHWMLGLLNAMVILSFISKT